MEEIVDSHNWSQSVVITSEAVTIGSNQLCSHQPQVQLITTAPTTSATSCGKSLAVAVATSCSQTRSNNKTPDLTWKTPKSG